TAYSKPTLKLQERPNRPLDNHRSIHINPWDHGGPTDLANGVLLCRYHHVTVHHKGWQVRMGTHGHPEYVPPEWVDRQQRILRP
ncbi:HNH endonuclease, partial [Actinopolymorpha sp. NPDC004070]|uniref:HNH endonuclease n=1 Tax=Actinopolymorpha sp. NPDC004070 TaxID=3154548 RepID=UPI0033A18E4A